jgi:hypothetical protein
MNDNQETGLISPTMILNSLSEYGYAHIREPVSLEAFEFLSSEIGTIELRTDIKVDRKVEALQARNRITGGRPSTYQADPLEFHSDNPRMNVLAWYCVEQDEIDGATRLIDTSNVVEHFSEDELTVLTGINVRYSVWQPGSDRESFLNEPLLTKTAFGYRTYYQSWLLLDPYSDEQVAALNKFASYIHHMREAHSTDVKLAKDECLFIDNRRILHGRNALGYGSKRHLIRLYIRSAHLWG